jgi:prephenate dehydrogenase
VICPGADAGPEAVAAVTALVTACRAEPVVLGPAEHDDYVALVSHAPHVVAAAMAARLAHAPAGALTLSGPGLTDVTRIAGGDTGLWTQILAANAAPVARVLADVAADLSAAAQALTGAAEPVPGEPVPGEPVPGEPVPGETRAGQVGEAAAVPGHAAPLKVLAGLLDAGVAGVARIPGKRGKTRREDVVVQVVIPDVPGELARLFQAAGEAGVNIEDIGIEHSPGLPVGVAELTVRPQAAATLADALAAAGWPVRR